MKRLLFKVMIVLIAVIIVACESVPTPLVNNLVVYTKLSVDHKSVLQGVKDAVSGKIIIKAENFSNITADGNLILCFQETPERICVYTHEGEMLGAFDKFTHWTTNGDYYLGAKYGWYLYYFPLHHQSIWAQEVLTGISCLVLKTEKRLEIRDNYGQCLFILPQNAQIIKEEPYNQESEFFFLIEEEKGYTLYNQHGKHLKRLSGAEWQKMKTHLHNYTDNQNSSLSVLSGSNIANL